MGIISLEEATERLQTLREAHLAENKRAAAAAVSGCIAALEAMPKVEPVIKVLSLEAERTVSVEPFFPGGAIGRDVYRCGHCRMKVGKHDAYCLRCGRKLVDSK